MYASKLRLHLLARVNDVFFGVHSFQNFLYVRFKPGHYFYVFPQREIASDKKVAKKAKAVRGAGRKHIAFQSWLMK